MPQLSLGTRSKTRDHVPNPKGNTKWKKGVSGNPAGKPKGAKNRLPYLVLQGILKIWEELEGDKEKSLLALAKKDPKWFYEMFIRQLIPKNIDVSFFNGRGEEAEDLNSLSDEDLLTIIKSGTGMKIKESPSPPPIIDV